jgi:DNA-binding HxlR family transcriptional regulator
MSNHSTSVYNSTEERAIALLGANHSIDTVASATGVSASRISQLMSQEGFKEKVLSLRVKSLQENNARDAKYDQLEDKVLDKIADMLPLVHRPMELSKLLQTFNIIYYKYS